MDHIDARQSCYAQLADAFCPIEDALADVAAGKIILIVDDEDRENEGDMFVAAELCTTEKMNSLVRDARGLVCAPLDTETAERLKLGMMTEHSTDLHGTAFTISVDAVDGTTTGISAEERAVTARVLADPSTRAEDLRRPGHLFPLRARPGGVLERSGHTEAAVDLARMAGLRPAGVICEVLNDDGTMARLPRLVEIARANGMKIVSIADLIQYRLTHERLVTREASVALPTAHGDFDMLAYRYQRDARDDIVHLALVKGDVGNGENVLVRVHSECLTGDVFGSERCDCGPQLHTAMEMIDREGRGVLLYIRQEGRGIGLLAKLKAYELQERGMDTEEANIALGFPPDMRDYGVAAQILSDIGVKSIRLITNNPKKIDGLERYGTHVVERVPIETEPNEHNQQYLRTKCQKMGHILHL